MKKPENMTRTEILVECAMLIALAFVLNIVSSIIPGMPFGGSVTICSRLPIVVISLRHRTRWGCLGAFVYSLLNLLLGMQNVVYVGAADGLARNAFFMILCALLDYVLAFSALGFCGAIAYAFKNRTIGLVSGITLTGLMGYLCSVLSGIIIWGSVANDGFRAVAAYSVAYNSAWFFPDLAILLVAAIPLSRMKKLGVMPEITAVED